MTIDQKKIPKQPASSDQDTLGYHRALAAVVFGEESPATAFLDKKISESPNGAQEKVVAPEGQLVYLLTRLHQGLVSVEEFTQQLKIG